MTRRGLRGSSGNSGLPIWDTRHAGAAWAACAFALLGRHRHGRGAATETMPSDGVTRAGTVQEPGGR
jgi:hypothetical protein